MILRKVTHNTAKTLSSQHLGASFHVELSKCKQEDDYDLLADGFLIVLITMSLIYSYVSSFHCPGGLQVEEECSSALNNSLQGMA